MKKIIILLFVLFYIKDINAQNIGINTPTPNAALDINGDMALRIANISLNAGINNNVNTSTTKRSTYRLIDATAAFTITGLDGGADGRVITLVNTTNFVVTLIHESANSTGANRFTLSNGLVTMFCQKQPLHYNTVQLKTGGFWLATPTWKPMPGNLQVMPVPILPIIFLALSMMCL